MKSWLLRLSFIWFSILSLKANSQPCNMQGVYSIGPTGSFSTITAVITALRTNGLGNHVFLELQSTYNSSSETFPISFDNIPCIDVSRTITIRPQLGATINITSPNNVATIDLNNSRYILIDGRPGGAGTTNQLTISNTSISGSAIRFINDASWNKVEYTNIMGVNTSISNGVVSFLTTNQTVTNGNSNNTISKCLITKGATTPANCIYAAGTTGRKNVNNQIIDCNIADYYVSSGGAYGIKIISNNNYWQITGNSFYQTTQKNYLTSRTAGIHIYDTSSSGFVISNNFVGGSAPQCGGSKIMYGSFYNSIFLMLGDSAFTSIQNNTISNIGINIEVSGGYCAAIYMGMGKFRCGDETGNTIGNQSIPNSISIGIKDFFEFYGIVTGTGEAADSGADTCIIRNNKISGIQCSLMIPGDIFDGPLYGIYLRRQKRGLSIISNNTIGTPNSNIGLINNTFTDANKVIGICVETDVQVPPSMQPENNVINNTIVNLYGKTVGIKAITGRHKIIGNNLMNFQNLFQLGAWALSLEGIVVDGGTINTVVAANTIHSFFCNGTINTINGISIQNSTGCHISRNFIHSFQSSSAPTNNIFGIKVVAGNNYRIMNNMVRLGLDTSGNPVSGDQIIFGVLLDVDSAFTANNSIVISGNGTNPSASLIVGGNRAKTGTIINNILVNYRSTSSGTNKNYALRLDTQPLISPTINHNIFYTTGNLSFLGRYQGVDYSTIISWRNGLKADSNSIFYNPNFVNDTGGRYDINLHLNNPTPAEGTGQPSVFVTDDIDGEIRAGLTPTDIGADAGNFTFQDGDAPILKHEPFLGQPATVLFTYKLQITDNGTGVDTVGANKPKMWFRKKFPTTSTWKNVGGTLSSGTINGGTWNFIPNYTAAGISVNPGDSIEYYFVAQDQGIIPNIGFSNLQGTQHTNVNVQITPPTSPLRYLIFGYFPDTVYVGIGQPYTSLTNPGGFFQASHINIFDTSYHNPAIIITSDLSESGTFDYTMLLPNGPDVHMITNTSVVKVIRNNSNLTLPMIRFTNTSNLKLDGRVNGLGRYLRFINGHTTTPSAATPVFQTVNSSYQLNIRNCIFESNMNGNQYSVMIGSGYHRRLVFEDNIIRNIEPGGPDPAGLVGQAFVVGADGADSVVVKNNEIINFSARGLLLTSPSTTPNDLIYIDSNHFYHNSVIQPTGNRYVIDVNSYLKNTTISNNFIGGTDRFCGGTPWEFSAPGSGNTFNGIRIWEDTDTLTPLSIQGNTIQNIRFTNWGYAFTGIYCTNGSLLIGTEKGNQIGSLFEDSSIFNVSSSYGIYGRVAIGTPVSVNPIIRVENNRINGFAGSLLTGIYFETKRALLKNNIISRFRASGTYFSRGINGMNCWLDEGTIEKNHVSDLLCNFTDIASVNGIGVFHTGLQDLIIARNRITGLETNAPASSIVGIYNGAGKYIIHNNQVNLSNGTNSQEIDLRGILLNGYGGTTRISKVYYNTVRLGGNTNGSIKSYAVYINQNFPISQFRNNILVNERTGGTGQHIALGLVSGPNPPITSWPAGNSTNNYFIATDTSSINEWRTTGVVGISQWRTFSQGDTASYASNVSDVPTSILFVSPATGNLNINTLNPLCWNVNGKGIPVSLVSADFDSAANIRSTNITTGSTDIGSDEFNSNTIPPALIITGDHINGGTEYLTLNARRLASIQWGPTGTLPSLGSPRYYSGIWPNDTSNNNTLNGARYLNTYWDIQATGGSGYSYNLILHYDSSILGKVTNETTMLVNKRNGAVPGSWQVIQPTMHNTLLKMLTISNQSSFSEFTSTDSLATLVTGDPLADLVIENPSISPSTVSTGNTFTAHFVEANYGYLNAAPNKIKFYISSDTTLTPGTNGDTLVGFFDLINSVIARSNSGPQSAQLMVPCSLTPGQYYLLYVADALNSVIETDESNNIASQSIIVAQGLSIPAVPIITASPGASACGPATISLTANSAGCINCTYTWNTGASGNSITVNTTGFYSVIASNACGSATNGQLVTINPLPVISISASQSMICLGSTVTLTATGASSYTWSGPGLSTTSGSVVIATPPTTGTATYTVIGTTNGCSQTQTINITVNAIPTISVSANPSTICLGATVTLTATGATSYTWTGPGLITNTGPVVSAIPVTAGNASYSVTGIANGCSAVQSVIVTVNAIPSINVTANPNTICLGSTVTLTATGANTYTWTGPGLITNTGPVVTAIPVSAGNASYSVTGSTNGCSAVQSVIVTVNDIPTVTVSANPGTICLGATVTLSATGATSYSWTGPGLVSNTGPIVTAVPSSSGNANYSATGTTNGCSNVQSVNVTVNPIPTVNISVNPNPICLGTSTTLTATGATSYSWTGSGLNSTTGPSVIATPPNTGNITYAVVGTSNSCSANQSTNVTVLAVVTPTLNISYTGCPSSTLNFQATATNGGSNPLFEWFVNNVIAGTGPSFILNNAINNTQVSCNLTSNQPCASPTTVSVSETISCVITSVPNITGIESYFVAPNPFSDFFNFRIKLTNRKKIILQLFDIKGRDLYSFGPVHWIGENVKQINLAGFAPGVYFLKVLADNQQFTHKVLKIK